MAKAAKKIQTSNGGSSSRKGKNGNGKKANGKTEKPDQKAKPANSKTDPDTTVDEPKEKKRRERAPTEGEPLKRVLIFLSDDDIAALKAEVGDRGMSTRIREIIKDYLAERS